MIENITNDDSSKNYIQKSKNFLKNNFDWKLALLGVVIMSPIIYTVNKLNGHENVNCLIAAGKQGLYTFLVGGYVTKLSKNLAIKYRNAFSAYSRSIIIPSIITISLTYGVHKIRGTPEPIKSTIPTALIVPPLATYFSYKEREKTYFLKP